MKLILIVDVPDDYTEITVIAITKKNPYFNNYPDFTEFTPPSDEEINKEANTAATTWENERERLVVYGTYRNACKWFKSLLQ